jgi:hypothetical protein
VIITDMRGVIIMLEGVTVVLGFMVVIFLFFFTLLHFLGKELHSHDAEHVDPLPKKRF